MSLIIKSLYHVHPDNEVLFHDLHCILNAGEKAALVGINGAGKSTLLRIIAGKIQPTSGDITGPVQPWYVPQHLGEFDTWPVARALGADQQLDALHAILGGDTDARHFTQLGEAWDIENRVRMVLEKWDLGAINENRLLGTLSGGQKTRVFLAAIDLNNPAFILLDEPSNHLDTRMRKQLYDMIRQSRSTLLIVSHDRALLSLMTSTWELSENGIRVFGGNFEFYQQKKMEKVHALRTRLQGQTKALKELEKKAIDMLGQRAQQESKGRSVGLSNSIPRIIAGGLKNKAERSTARMMHTHEEKIAGLIRDIEATRAQIAEYETLRLKISAAVTDPERVLINMTGINFRYDDHLLWNGLNIQIRAGQRVRIEGKNGSGKTTLLKIITRELTPCAGTMEDTGFSFYYLDQEYAMINPKLNVYEQLEAYNKRGLDEQELEQILLNAQFSPAAFDKKCALLSGGERMKLSLGCLLVSDHAPDILILDEPTNNLDVQSLQVLTLALKNFSGTLLVISHDEFFIDAIAIDYSINLS